MNLLPYRPLVTNLSTYFAHIKLNLFTFWSAPLVKMSEGAHKAEGYCGGGVPLQGGTSGAGANPTAPHWEKLRANTPKGVRSTCSLVEGTFSHSRSGQSHSPQ